MMSIFRCKKLGLILASCLMGILLCPGVPFAKEEGIPGITGLNWKMSKADVFGFYEKYPIEKLPGTSYKSDEIKDAHLSIFVKKIKLNVGDVD